MEAYTKVWPFSSKFFTPGVPILQAGGSQAAELRGMGRSVPTQEPSHLPMLL